jgi:hypothetical protein
MRKLLILLALLLGIGVTVRSTPAHAIIYPPCDTYCEGRSGSTLCSCPAGTEYVGKTVTCSNVEWGCNYSN